MPRTQAEKEYDRRYREKHKKKIQITKERYREKNKDKIKKYNQKYWQIWYGKNKQKRILELKGIKQKARIQLLNAIRQGKIVRQSCSVVGCISSMGHAHHFDYSKPLEVIWLCIKHHHQIHKNNN